MGDQQGDEAQLDALRPPVCLRPDRFRRERVGLAPMLDRPAAGLTVAGRKRLELARALATRPRLLLLDEVLAGLNPSEIRDIVPVIRGIRDDGVTVLMIEHVLQAVMSLCSHIHVLAGVFTLYLDGQWETAGPGDTVLMPRGLPHAYYNRSEADARALFWVSPTGRLAHLFDQLHDLTDPDEVVRQSALHDVDFLPPGSVPGA